MGKVKVKNLIKVMTGLRDIEVFNMFLSPWFFEGGCEAKD